MFFVLMSLPMLAIISLWGGISVEFLLLHFAFSMLLILLVGSMCLWVSVTAVRYTEAMMLAYTLEFALAYGGFPLAIIAADVRGGNPLFPLSPWAPAVFALLMLGGTSFFYVIALRRFRTLRSMSWMKRSEPPPRRLPRPQPKRPRPRSQPRQSTGRPIPEDALLWKETEYNRYVIDFPNHLAWRDPVRAFGVLALREPEHGSSLAGGIDIVCRLRLRVRAASRGCYAASGNYAPIGSRAKRRHANPHKFSAAAA
jgi:hypothetical protein